MCGIAGFVNYEDRASGGEVLAAMIRALGRRGPDGHGTAESGPCHLAHTRLSIIDLALSTQPMRVPDLPFTLVYNGELYNYRELRRTLEGRGHRFVTNGDTEVVLRMVAEFGEESLPRLDGMFAFGAWNTQTQTLLLARDARGEKPLFYARAPGGSFVFGSEIKAVLCVPGIQRTPNLGAVRQALRFRAVYGEHTLYEGVLQVPPGGLLRLSRSGSSIGRFISIVDQAAKMMPSLASQCDAALVKQGSDLFRESVRERLVSDVPVGVFLSGGLDSSLLTAEMASHRGPDDPVRSYSVGFKDDASSELPFAREVAEVIGTRHTEVLVGPLDYIARLDELTGCRDAPMSEPADVAIACMSRRARQDVKVVLSGEGADEAFAGYPKYRLANFPQALGVIARMVGPGLIVRAAGVLGLDRRRVAIAARAVTGATELDRLSQWFSYVERSALQQWLPGIGWSDAEWSATLDPHASALASVPKWSPLARMQAVDCLTWLPGNLLERGDRMTMAEGLEARPPFLDKELVAFGLALPDRMKVRGGVGKWIVRQWAHERLPASIINRKKWGFRVPLAAWFRGEMREYLHDTLLRKGGFHAQMGDMAAVRRLLADHDSGSQDLNLTLWTLLTMEIWWSRMKKSHEE